MGLYLRKSFRAGPARFNLSKSGLGLSAGVKGARLGAGPGRGSYVHAGRHGLYYRKRLASGKSHRRSRTSEGAGCAWLLLILFGAGIVLALVTWLIENPGMVIGGFGLLVVFLLLRFFVKHHQERKVKDYKEALDHLFVIAQTSPSAVERATLIQRKDKLPTTDASKRAVADIETGVYEAILDKVLDDGHITADEAAMIAAAEQVLSISPAVRLKTKKDIFSAAYLEAIQDREITEGEQARLENLIQGLGIPREEVLSELKLVNEIRQTQSLRLPFMPIPTEEVTAPIQKSEEAYYQCPAKVLSKRKSKETASGFAYTVRRDGIMILTNKRVFVVGEGTTTIRFSDIGDVDVDMDEGVIEICKTGSRRPTVLKLDAPIYIGRAIDLLVNAEAGGATIEPVS